MVIDILHRWLSLTSFVYAARQLFWKNKGLQKFSEIHNPLKNNFSCRIRSHSRFFSKLLAIPITALPACLLIFAHKAVDEFCERNVAGSRKGENKEPYLHSHFVWHKLSLSFIETSFFLVLSGSQYSGSFFIFIELSMLGSFPTEPAGYPREITMDDYIFRRAAR